MTVVSICQHASDATVDPGIPRIACDLGIKGGHPGLGWCAQCDKFDPTAGNERFVDIAVRRAEWLGKKDVPWMSMEEHYAIANKPIPRELWPVWAVGLSKLANPGETGVGDVAERIFGKFGGQLFKAAFKAMFGECGCDARKESWNLKYPL